MRIEKETDKVKWKRKEEEELIEQLNKYDALVEDYRQAQAARDELAEDLSKEMGKICSVLLPGFSGPTEREVVLQALGALLDEKNRAVQQVLDEVHWTGAGESCCLVLVFGMGGLWGWLWRAATASSCTSPLVFFSSHLISNHDTS